MIYEQTRANLLVAEAEGWVKRAGSEFVPKLGGLADTWELTEDGVLALYKRGIFDKNDKGEAILSDVGKELIAGEDVPVVVFLACLFELAPIRD